ncbi:MAG: flagellar brake protein [Gammaproteobacteria bacterium]|nr:flagellar brake protein [Gammaproteobacteria bacterium]
MRVEELGLAIGDSLQLQIGEDDDHRYPVIFYGMNPSGSILVSTPKNKMDKAMLIREGQPVKLRFVAKNVASAFSTQVISSRGQPYPYLHLKLPKEIETVEVRKGIRVDTHLSVTVINNTLSSPALTATLTSLSCSGARIEAPIKTAVKGNKLDVTMSVQIADIEKLITMATEVTYVKDDDSQQYVYGINITDIDDEDMLTLRAFVYQELLIHLHMI